MTAVVNASGSLAYSQGTKSAGHVGTGAYEVIFNQNVTACTYVASIDSASVVPRKGEASGVGVAMIDTAGAAADLPFRLIVIC
jgi:hypothetical protein